MFVAGIPLLFFLIQAISNIGGKLENLKYITIYTLLPTSKIISGEGGILFQNMTMIVLIVLLFGSGIWWFCRRDLAL